MKFIFLLIPIFVFAKTYMSKIEPIEEYNIFAEANGKIVLLDKSDEKKVVNKVIIKIDDSIEKEKLKLYQKQLELYQREYSIKKRNYNNYLKIKGISSFDKDTKLIETIELSIKINDLKIKIKELLDTISKKSIKVENLYIKEFLVNRFDYLVSGSKVANVYDISSSKLVVYVSKEDFEDILNKDIYINDKKSDLKILKLDITPDSTYISSYKVEIKTDMKNFGEVVKVEFKK